MKESDLKDVRSITCTAAPRRIAETLHEILGYESGFWFMEALDSKRIGWLLSVRAPNGASRRLDHELLPRQAAVTVIAKTRGHWWWDIGEKTIDGKPAAILWATHHH